MAYHENRKEDPMKNETPRWFRRTAVPALIAFSVAMVAVGSCSGCTTHPSHIYADRVFVDGGHTYRAYRNDRAAIITHDGGCTHPMHRCRDTVYNYGVTE